MADINYTDDVYTPDAGGHELRATKGELAPPSGLGGAVRVLGAAGSLALVIGIGVWGYKLVMRDVSGVPVVRALEGPMRVQPDNPGGSQADHQGLAVNAVAAAGAAAPTADRLMLAPRPVELTDEDKPMVQIRAEAEAEAETKQAETAAKNDPVAALVEQLTAGVAPISDENRPIVTLNDTATSEAEQQATAPEAPVVLGDMDAPELAEDTSEAEFEAQPAVVTGPGLKRSLRPLARPARAVSSSGSASADDPVLASAINSAVDAVASLEIDPDSLPSGTRMAQLGAYDSIDIARAEWDKLNVRFEDYLEGKQRVIQKASSGGRTFYRLRALGFDDLSDTRRFCSALVSENADCIPVTAR